jgi:hypothetical protein
VISKLVNFIKTNLLGIAVALGVCAFLYEGLIRYNPAFVLTKYAGVLVVFVAIYNKYNDKSIDETPLPKSKYDLNWGVLKRYLKKRLREAPLQLLIFSLLYFFVDNKSYAHEYTVLWLWGFVEGFFAYAKRQKYLAGLEEKGFSERQVNIDEFIRQWEENRERGLVRYCIVDGGIIAGALLSIVVSIVWMLILSTSDKRMFADGPGQIFQFIGITYLIGAVIGIAAYRITWSVNQKRFDNLKMPIDS